jgi:ankyrin repeat protein
MYAGRGGFSEVVRFLLEKKASPLKQDSSGGTVFHHAVEKGHLNVMEVMLEHGVDVYSAIEIADNAGRTPLFEAVESTFDIENEEVAMLRQTEIIRILTRKKA